MVALVGHLSLLLSADTQDVITIIRAENENRAHKKNDSLEATIAAFRTPYAFKVAVAVAQSKQLHKTTIMMLDEKTRYDLYRIEIKVNKDVTKK
jgi:hypothetical protein